MSIQQRLYTLKGFTRDEEQVQYFTHDEKDLAIHCAKQWFERGWEPCLYSFTVRGDFKVWYDYQKENDKAIKRPAIKRRKAA